MTVKELINKLVDKKAIYCQLAKVLSVDETARSCEVEYPQGGTDSEVRLQAKMEITEGIVLIPKVNSDVLIGYLSENVAFVISTAEIDKVIITIGNSELKIESSTITMNGGNLGGLVKVSPLVSAYNNVVTDMLAIQTLFTGIGLTFVPQTTLKTDSNFENTKVKH